MFGFSQNHQFIPDVFKNYSLYEINYIFLNFYNTLNEDDMKIPYSYANKAQNLKELFILRIKDLLQESDDIKCFYSKNIIQAYISGASIKLENKIPKSPLAKMILSISNDSILINPQIAFENFVFDKICKSNPKLKITIKDDLCIIEDTIAILIKFNQNQDKDIEWALKHIGENSFEKFYIVYPRSENFTHYKQIRAFLCENNNIVLKLVPYTINNQILRRC
ncbi:hypothetical protein FPD38_03870 [Campylobacter volucris]|uniref:Uncharacterized protein n=1 Tax=Campylobacter volucris TaxID=1031542 RepID=A0A5C7E2I6_9BACT|nr:hypothetical protein [Campylobacter volucris]TXE88441.1 hypothetical protein FPD38_03870 [Campylobacter volucris]